MSAGGRTQHRTLADILVDQGILERDDVDDALQIQSTTGETLTGVLVDMRKITPGEIAKIVSLHYQLPYINFRNFETDAKLLDLFKPEFLHQHKLMPFDCVGQMVLIAVTEIPPDRVLAEIPRTVKRKVAFYVTELDQIDAKLNEHRPLAENSELVARRRHIGHKGSTAKSEELSDKDKKAAEAAGMFTEKSGEDLLQALDDTWASIFDEMTAVSDDSDDESDLSEESDDVVENFETTSEL
jgi:hypothetical protein